jgi:hypothetical protein
MLNFDDDAHKFQVTPQSPQLALEFGTRMFFTSLTTGLLVAQLEATVAAVGTGFNSFLVFPALLFHAESVALVPPTPNAGAAEARFRSNFEFGFVQGARWGDVHLEYWASTAALGRTIVHISMPNTFEVDTETSVQPWTHAATGRFKVTNVTKRGAGSLAFKAEADFGDHPMLVFPHTIASHTTPALQRFLRWVTFTIDFRTIFCFRDKSDGSFTPISATEWRVHFDHLVSYTGNGANRAVNNRVGDPNFPRGGNPSIVNQTDRDILAMAKRGSPLLTPGLLQQRLTNAALRTETDETPNADFDSKFFQ